MVERLSREIHGSAYFFFFFSLFLLFLFVGLICLLVVCDLDVLVILGLGVFVAGYGGSLVDYCLCCLSE